MDFSKYKFKFLKKAQDIGDPPPMSRAPVTPITPTSPKSKTDVSSPPEWKHTVAPTVGSEEVTQMQQAMQNLAKVVISNTAAAHTGKDMKFEPGKDSRVKSKTSFNDFITEQYLQKSEVRGSEFSPRPEISAMPDKDKTRSEPWQLDIIMNTLVRIGNNVKGEFVIDGQWGRRTNNALLNEYAFGFSLLKIMADFGIASKKMTESDLGTLEKLIPKTDVELKNINSKELSERAKSITPILNKISLQYSEFEEKILERSRWKPFFEGDNPFETYSKVPSDPSQLTMEEKKVSDTYKHSPIAGLKLPSFPKVDKIFLGTLADPTIFETWMKNMGITDAANKTRFLKELEIQLRQISQSGKR